MDSVPGDGVGGGEKPKEWKKSLNGLFNARDSLALCKFCKIKIVGENNIFLIQCFFFFTSQCITMEVFIFLLLSTEQILGLFPNRRFLFVCFRDLFLHHELGTKVYGEPVQLSSSGRGWIIFLTYVMECVCLYIYTHTHSYFIPFFLLAIQGIPSGNWKIFSMQAPSHGFY